MFQDCFNVTILNFIFVLWCLCA